MNRPALLGQYRSIGEVDRLSEHVEDAAERFGADRNRDRLTEIDHLHAALQAVGRLHRNRSNPVLSQMLLDLDDDVDRIAAGSRGLDAERMVDFGKMSRFELDVDHGPDNLDDPADLLYLCRHPLPA